MKVESQKFRWVPEEMFDLRMLKNSVIVYSFLKSRFYQKTPDPSFMHVVFRNPISVLSPFCYLMILFLSLFS